MKSTATIANLAASLTGDQLNLIRQSLNSQTGSVAPWNYVKNTNFVANIQFRPKTSAHADPNLNYVHNNSMKVLSHQAPKEEDKVKQNN